MVGETDFPASENHYFSLFFETLVSFFPSSKCFQQNQRYVVTVPGTATHSSLKDAAQGLYLAKI